MSSTFLLTAISLLFFSSCSILDIFSLKGSPWQVEEDSLPSQNICPKEEKSLRYYSDNEALDKQFIEYQNTPKLLSTEAITYSFMHAAAGPHLISESSNISTIIKYKGKLYSNIFDDENKSNFSSYIWYLASILEQKNVQDSLKLFNKDFPNNLSVSKSLENYIEKNKDKLLKHETYGKVFFRGIAPLREGETFTREKIFITPREKINLDLNAASLNTSPNSYLCNFKYNKKSKTGTNISLEIASETFGIFKDENNFFLTTISSKPNLDHKLSKVNLGTNKRIPISTAICLNDKFITISKDEYFAKEILFENFLKIKETKSIDPTSMYTKKRKLNLTYPTRIVSEIFGDEEESKDLRKKTYWLKTLGNIEILNLTQSKVFYDPRKGSHKCN